ncbi:hypothetical protein X929_02740 [Petrotoga olearia DSM 13574]|uniref:Uncharacterized protein n=1 Tax=Petrotoga olearia DSM 13574 TaxID=1122955 RepID=A0A2K1P4P3_9BACT|nr:hypothetical protein X929_02740 [Petrotoga olearia DSM 13574]
MKISKILPVQLPLQKICRGIFINYKLTSHMKKAAIGAIVGIEPIR